MGATLTHSARVGINGRLRVPNEVREALHIREGDEVVFSVSTSTGEQTRIAMFFRMKDAAVIPDSLGMVLDMANGPARPSRSKGR